MAQQVGQSTAIAKEKVDNITKDIISLNDEVSKLQSELLELTGEDLSADNVIDRFAKKSRLNKQLKNWRDFLTKNTDGGAQSIISMKVEKIEFSTETLENGISTTTSNSSNEFLYFIKLGPLLNWMQNNLLLYNKSISLPYFKIDTGPNNYCMHYSKHISADPEICLIPVLDGPVKNHEYFGAARKRVQESFDREVKDGTDTNPSSQDKNSPQFYGALPSLFNTNAGGGETLRKEKVALQVSQANFDKVNTTSNWSSSKKVDKIPLIEGNNEAYKREFPSSVIYITKNRFFQFNLQESTLTRQGTWTINNNEIQLIDDTEVKPLPQTDKTRDVNDIEAGLSILELKNDFIINGFVANLMNINVNLNYIATVANNNIDEKGNLVLISFLNQLLTGINAALGYFHNFEIIYDQNENSLKIYDHNVLKYGKLKTNPNPPARFNLYAFEPLSNGNYSLGSFIYDVNFTSQLSNDFANMITISSQSDTNVLGMEFNGLSQYNAGIVDRVIPKKQSLSEINNNEKKLSKDNLTSMLETAKIYARQLWNELSINRETIDAFMALNRDIANYYINDAVESGTIPSPTVIPYNLSLSMMGLGGMKIFERFDTDEKILPPMYDNSAYNFVIKSISHEISNNKWTTTVESQVINKEDINAPEIPISADAAKPIAQSISATNTSKVASCLELPKGSVKGKQKITKNSTADEVIKAVIDYFEGGYYHPTHAYKDGVLRPGYEIGKNSGETLWGIDRAAGGQERSNNATIKSAGINFWGEIDKISGFGGYKAVNTNTKTGKWDINKYPPIKSAWKHYYNPGSNNKVLVDNLNIIITTAFNDVMENFNNYKELKNLLLSDGRALLMWYRATWNGPGHAQNYANNLKRVWNDGERNIEKLMCADLAYRYNYYSIEGFKMESPHIKNVIGL